MDIELKKEPENVAKLKIKIPAQEGVSAYNTAVTQMSKNMTIPGFRKGKAPRTIIEKNIGKEKIKYEALSNILPSIIGEAIKEQNLDTVTQPQVIGYKFELGEDLELEISVELRPEVTLGQYKGLTVKVEEYKLPEDAFDKSLNSVLEQYSTLEEVVDRATEATDIVVFDFDGYAGEEKIPHGEAKNYTMDLSNSNFIPGFAEQLVGKPLETDFEIKVTFPKEYHEETLAGKEAIFKCKIHEIKTRIIPELTDEFAQKAGPFKTVADLKANIEEYLDKQVKEQTQRRTSNAVFEAVLNGSTVDIQKTMIEREKNSLLEEYKQKLASQGFSWENAVEAQGIEDILKNVQEDAVARIKNSLVINKIAELEGIRVEPEDFKKELTLLKNAYQLDEQTLLSQLKSNPAIINQLTQQSINDKTINFLVENSTIKFVKPKK